MSFEPAPKQSKVLSEKRRLDSQSQLSNEGGSDKSMEKSQEIFRKQSKDNLSGILRQLKSQKGVEVQPPVLTGKISF